MRMIRRRRLWPRFLVAVFVLGAGAATLVVVQPLWVFDVLGKVAPRIVWRVETSQPLVALSFDDGPAPEATPQVLALLAHHHARATFFLIGERARAYPGLVSAIRRGGHEVGNHSDGRRPLLRASEQAFLESLLRAERALGLRGKAKLYRPPSGLVSPGQLTLLAARRYRCVLGSAYPYDPWRPSITYIRWLVDKNLAPGTIVILHDGIPDPSRSLAALEGILEAGEEKGLRFVTVGELLEASGR
jgi:peptidoglycan/xylan/chitin deacetylase (PgdA/CDA1 family)